MKNIKKVFIIILLGFMLWTPNVNAYAKNSKEYKTCVKNSCDKIKKASDKAKCKAKCEKKGNSTNTSTQQTTSTKTQATTKTDFNFCASTAVIWQIVGWVFLVVKIVIPLLLIILGVLDISKAVLASKDDEIKKAAKTFGMRAIAAVILFFIPTIVGIVMGIIVNFKDSGAKADYEVCKKCILTPSKCDTSKDVGKN